MESAGDTMPDHCLKQRAHGSKQRFYCCKTTGYLMSQKYLPLMSF